MAPRRVDRSEISICGKYFVFFVNFAILVVSPILLGFGIYILVLKEKSVSTWIDFFLDPSVWLVITGAIGSVIAFLGCFGALREITPLLRIYYWSVNFLILIELFLICFIFIFTFSPDILKNLNIYPQDLLKDAVVKYRDDPDMQDFIDNIQTDLGCCGYSDSADGYKDWNANPYFNCSSENNSFEKCAVPHSCCIIEDGDAINLLCGADAQSDELANSKFAPNINKGGCLWVLRTYLMNNILVVGGVMIGSLIPQLLLVHFSRSLRDQILVQLSKWQRN
ncbi:tetraspanin-33-like [Mizuhopecten yessoensis]|uniref:Tetraspanin n=1 Tax=Mizuhopecten yessoensis TaxID=6573 RepID=A0A210PPD6_MIZYE|nr:tetraspanin-33-like [Mizuhopecten yessoensis]OWF38342.1 Tetraspanin-33 [Mizuhopecten yessoensis]